MRRMIKWAVIAVIAVVGLSYGVYATEYQGNYNVKVSVPVTGWDYNAGYHSVTATGATTSAKAISIGDFFSGLWYVPSGPSSNPANPYVCYVELTPSGGVTTTQHQTINSSAQQVPFEFSQTLSFTFKNIEPGSGTVHIYIMDQTLSTKLYDHTWTVVIG